nr:MAG TPA: hypothetical protein [Caudoviricetes sp.]
MTINIYCLFLCRSVANQAAKFIHGAARSAA